MKFHQAFTISRSAGFVLAVMFQCGPSAAEPPMEGEPRATSGDPGAEPAWAQRLTLTVGPADADLNGTTDKVLQAAVDYVARLGGGTVKIKPGTYRLGNAIYLHSNVRIVGSGADSVLFKQPSISTKLTTNADWWDQGIALADPTGFEVGDGVCVRAKNPPSAYETIVRRTLIARRGSVFKLDRALRLDFLVANGARAATLFPLLDGENVSDVAIEDLTLDGNRSKNENLDGNYAGCIFLQDCNRITLRGVTARNYNGDGISWQICHDVVVENCVSENNAERGLHPGSASHRTIIRNNRITGNGIGLFFCAGVRYGVAEKNFLADNGVGISIGYRDTENLIAENQILRSKDVGVLFRPEGESAFSGNHNRIERNRIVDSGAAKGIAIDVQGKTQSIVIEGNEILETRAPAQRVAVNLGKDTKDIELNNNTIRGFSSSVDPPR